MNHKVPLCKFCNPQISNPSKRKSKKRKSGWDSDQSDEPDRPNYPPGIMKPDITFFGEKLDDVFDRSLLADRQVVDLLIVIGTSLKVSPVSETLAYLPHSVPQILINKTPIKHINPDVDLMLGDADTIVQHLCQKLGWELPVSAHDRSDLDALHSNVKKRPSAEFESQEPQRVGNSHVWLFEGAEGGKWVEEMEKSQQTLDSPYPNLLRFIFIIGERRPPFEEGKSAMIVLAPISHRRSRNRKAFLEARDVVSR
ncbi:NAD-dependent protein deacetylase hst1 [Grifola frondosa]|uniref:NAD-dependent protein deacetylase hst1 n=1 Tax=Grifola frondosa TaxID=5627 RepID=A0A1C7MAY2_GRIFR|nr:NAD-dependent protein deacetylase hst1 [Grifola frondosa]